MLVNRVDGWIVYTCNGHRQIAIQSKSLADESKTLYAILDLYRDKGATVELVDSRNCWEERKGFLFCTQNHY
jgi:hypothetical protein